MNKIFQPIINPNISNDIPIRLKIPSINVDALIQQVGLTPEGVLDIPVNVMDVGWYKFGSRPGQKGSAVIDGHVDGPDGSPAIFSDLRDLKEGDSIMVENDKNKPIYFVVKKISNYAVDSYASEVFNDNDGIHLNLITCNGAWDVSKNTYTERLIVFADAVQP